MEESYTASFSMASNSACENYPGFYLRRVRPGTALIVVAAEGVTDRIIKVKIDGK